MGLLNDIKKFEIMYLKNKKHCQHLEKSIENFYSFLEDPDTEMQICKEIKILQKRKNKAYISYINQMSAIFKRLRINFNDFMFFTNERDLCLTFVVIFIYKAFVVSNIKHGRFQHSGELEQEGGSNHFRQNISNESDTLINLMSTFMTNLLI